jgi:hypothetical protein
MNLNSKISQVKSITKIYGKGNNKTETLKRIKINVPMFPLEDNMVGAL